MRSIVTLLAFVLLLGSCGLRTAGNSPQGDTLVLGHSDLLTLVERGRRPASL